MAKIWESGDSRAITDDPPGRVDKWEIRDVVDESEAWALLRSRAFLAVFHPLGKSLRLKGTDLAPVDGFRGHWTGTVTYAASEPDQNEAVVNFDVASETQHISQSLATVGQFVADGGTAANYKGAIGVEGDEVKGCDIVAPRLSFGWTVYKPKEVVTVAYVKSLASMVGRTNANAFLSFAAGELLFVGASGSRRAKQDDWELTFKFDASPNISDITIGDITGISKLGFDYLWVAYEADEDDDAKIVKPQPRQVNVERVYRSADFSPLSINA